MTSFGWDTVPRRAVGLESRGSGSEQPFHDGGTSFPEHPVTWWGWVSPGPLVPDPPDSYFADARGGVTPDHQYSSKSHGENTGRERTAAQIPNVKTPGFPHLTNADTPKPLPNCTCRHAGFPHIPNAGNPERAGFFCILLGTCYCTDHPSTQATPARAVQPVSQNNSIFAPKGLWLESRKILRIGHIVLNQGRCFESQ